MASDALKVTVLVLDGTGKGESAEIPLPSRLPQESRCQTSDNVASSATTVTSTVHHRIIPIESLHDNN